MGAYVAKVSDVWNLHALPSDTIRALENLAKEEWLRRSHWYLAGGTALALQAGHRVSVDLDFFTEDNQFKETELLAHLAEGGSWETDVEEPGTIYGKLLGAKVSFIAYPFFLPAAEPHWYGSIRVLDKQDIAVMKIIAISQRGRKRDFFDLFWCAHHIEPLETIITRLKVQYPSVAHDYHHILKALVYFEDAESDPEPIVRFDASWRAVKAFFRKEVPAISLRLIR
ncbi:MAG: nucleotidyl transferase AbiEii/AbiGii toxin family protein [Patescibacteria group bacterium]